MLLLDCFSAGVIVPLLLSAHSSFISFSFSVNRYFLKVFPSHSYIHVKSDIHSPIRFFFFGKIILESHHPVLVGDTGALSIVILMEGFSGFMDIPLVGESAVFLRCHIPAISFIVDVVLQLGRNLNNFQFLYVITPQSTSLFSSKRALITQFLSGDFFM